MTAATSRAKFGTSCYPRRLKPQIGSDDNLRSAVEMSSQERRDSGCVTAIRQAAAVPTAKVCIAARVTVVHGESIRWTPVVFVVVGINFAPRTHLRRLLLLLPVELVQLMVTQSRLAARVVTLRRHAAGGRAAPHRVDRPAQPSRPRPRRTGSDVRATRSGCAADDVRRRPTGVSLVDRRRCRAPASEGRLHLKTHRF